MKRLLLLRHAKSAWDDPKPADFDRPLAPRGRKAAATMMHVLRALRQPPDLVLCSAARRTRETFDLMIPVLEGIPVRFETGLYETDAQALLTRLRKLDADVDTVLMIGHNPGLEQLALTLAVPETSDGKALDRMTAKFPTCALAELECEVHDWKALAPGRARLVGFVRPRDLPSGARGLSSDEGRP